VIAVRYEKIDVPDFYRIKILGDVNMRNTVYRMVTCRIAGVFVGIVKM